MAWMSLFSGQEQTEMQTEREDVWAREVAGEEAGDWH